MLDAGHQFLLGGRIARQLVRDHDTRRPALLLQQLAQEALGGPLVAPALHQHVEHGAVPVDRPPQPVLRAGDLDLDLVEVPLVAGTGQPPPDLVRERLAELEAPLPNGLVADRDAASGQQLLDHPQGEREAEVEPHGVADDLRREPVAGVGGLARRCHAGPVAGCPPPRKRSHADLRVPAIITPWRRYCGEEHVGRPTLVPPPRAVPARIAPGAGRTRRMGGRAGRAGDAPLARASTTVGVWSRAVTSPRLDRPHQLDGAFRVPAQALGVPMPDAAALDEVAEAVASG